MSQAVRLTPHETVRRLEHFRKERIVKVLYTPDGVPPPAYLQLKQDDQPEIRAGCIHVAVAGQERELGPSSVCDVSGAGPHKVWNTGDEPADSIYVTPPREWTCEPFAVFDRLQRQERVGRDGMPRLPTFGVYLTAYRHVFPIAGPQWLFRSATAGPEASASRGLRAALRHPKLALSHNQAMPSHGQERQADSKLKRTSGALSANFSNYCSCKCSIPLLCFGFDRASCRR